MIDLHGVHTRKCHCSLLIYPEACFPWQRVVMSRIVKVAKEDDCILFLRAKPEEASCISSVLQRYQQFSGQKLGLPDVVGRSKKAVFSILKERMWKRLQGWKCKFLSHADKDLFKTIAKAIPTYVMQCFRLPIGLCEELKSIISQFWWVKEFEKENASL
ncbi:uncharacterized protein LOC110651925 [Hevea brasiliensis]|uniref:uncharacterized protein LOC110651925 n=1 Tax=Hevea brasiliensis TaxID=3981 RepID=UPI0025D90FE7|nr:uncharacterized protein LOC110651925 [Hevea brasiliensis]